MMMIAGSRNGIFCDRTILYVVCLLPAITLSRNTLTFQWGSTVVEDESCDCLASLCRRWHECMMSYGQNDDGEQKMCRK
ncbi:MAG: hypothetical protein ACI8RD_005216 [Bacillariaceae sp.]|jgi:hypothetical protein